jgi:hypothetical protein
MRTILNKEGATQPQTIVRVRSTGNYLSGKKDNKGRIELWEGGRLVGYMAVKPDKVNCWIPGIK